ncbi:hypothetical protein ABZ584_18260 [Streptomyces antibioticus]|uniref:hypothetical protein n=1 Tax=Streptomyces antibioticus TaxID=1890 RepID=UPI0033D0CDEE
MITPADDFADGPDALDPDDPLTVVLRPPPAGRLAPPPGRYEEIRRGAARRRGLRAAAGAAATCVIAGLAVLLPLRLLADDAPGAPTAPLAPPPATRPSVSPSLPAATDRATAVPSQGTGDRDARGATDAPRPVPSPSLPETSAPRETQGRDLRRATTPAERSPTSR